MYAEIILEISHYATPKMNNIYSTDGQIDSAKLKEYTDQNPLLKDVQVSLTVFDEENYALTNRQSYLLHIPFGNAWWREYDPKAHRSSHNYFSVAGFTPSRWKEYTLEFEVLKGSDAPIYVRLVITGGGWK